MRPVQDQFRKAQASIGRQPPGSSLPSPKIAEPATSEMVIPETVIPTGEWSSENDSYAQVESLVLPTSMGGLKPGITTGITTDGITWDDDIEVRDSIKRPSPLTIRLSERQKGIIRTKARAAGISVNRFMLAASLGSDYRPPMNPELTRALLDLNHELLAQGNNLNQIARQLNAGVILPGQSAMLDALAASILETLRCIREAFASAGPGRGP